METIFSSPLVREIILPFLLVFVLIFAVLDKSKIFGEGKRQINALIALAVALIFITFSKAVGIVTSLMPFLAVLAVVILIFLILFSFGANEKEGLKIPKGVNIAIGIVVLVALIVAVLVVTDYWNKLVDIFTGENSSSIATSVIFVIIVVAAVAAVIFSGKKKE